MALTEQIIISASRRTDIPAFYSEWLMNRIRAGYFVKVNPYNSEQRKQVSLLPAEVAAIVFWTKNPLPLMPDLPLLDQQEYRYLFQFTLNNYRKVFEPRVPAFRNRIEIFKRLSDQIGPDKVLWRYDPIIVSNLNSVEDHLSQFHQIAKTLQGYTHRVTISLVVLYDKVKTNFKKLAQEQVLEITDLRVTEHREQLKLLVRGLGLIAGECGLTIYSCSEKIALEEFNILPGSCIDIQLINRVFKTDLKIAKDKYQRPECRCASSIDMGTYDTCRFGCTYCYANTNSQRALQNAGNHDPESPTMKGN
jgi:DNA repair photolyase